MPIPTVLWGQRKDKLYVTLDIQVRDGVLRHRCRVPDLSGDLRRPVPSPPGVSQPSLW